MRLKEGDRVVYILEDKIQWVGVVNEFLPDGEVYCTADDGSYHIVKWSHLRGESGKFSL